VRGLVASSCCRLLQIKDGIDTCLSVWMNTQVADGSALFVHGYSSALGRGEKVARDNG